MKQLVVLAGGKGTRLGSHLGDLPKPMMDVDGLPLLERQLLLARKHGFTHAVLFTGFRADAITEHFGDGTRLGMSITHHVESEPLGTAGAVLEGLSLLDERFCVLYGDTLLDVDLSRMWQTHQEREADVTLFLHPNDHPQDSDLVELNDAGWVTALHGYPHAPDAQLPNRVNAALYVIEKRALTRGPRSRRCDFAKHVFPELLREGARLLGYESPEYIKDMGTPGRYERVLADFRGGRVARRSLGNALPGVLFDRDGTLTQQLDYVRQPAELNLVADAAPSLARLNREDFRTALVTNQPVLARGEVTFEVFSRIQNRLTYLLGQGHAYLDRLYYCPHHPDRGFEGEVTALKQSCDCRKPGTGMVENAIRDLHLDRSKSWLVGDSTVDVRTARTAGLKAVLLRTGVAGRDRKYADPPDYVFHSLTEASDFISEGHARWKRRLRPFASELRSRQVLAMGGLAHSGKSTAASVLRELLSERGIGLSVVCLDSFLKEPAQRIPGALSGAYDLERVKGVLAKVAQRTGALELELPCYDREMRSQGAPHPLHIGAADVVLFEGVLALVLAPVLEAASLRVYMGCSEVLRRQRFLPDYAWRGVEAQAAEALFEARELDEHPAIRASESRADVVLVEGTE